MVASLSSDKAVWDAVMNNEAVKELKESFYTGLHFIQETMRLQSLNYVPFYLLFCYFIVAVIIISIHFRKQFYHL